MFEFKHTATGSTNPQRFKRGAMRVSGQTIDRFTPTKTDMKKSLFDEWVPKEQNAINEVFRIIYKYDGIAGPAIDLISIMPWSDFSLSGVQDSGVMKVYEDSMRELRMETLLPELTSEFLQIGYSISTMIFSKKEGIFTDLIPHDPDFVEITPIPLRGYDPKFDLRLDPNFRKFMDSKDPRDIEARKEIPHDLMRQLKQGSKIPLDPLNTLFLPRHTTTTDIGTSILYRILPFYAIEKALTTGTIAAAHRRQRAIMHITAGETDMWEPTTEELSGLVELFMRADEDPIGAIVATRTGVEVSDVKSGSDFWKLSDEFDFLSNGKMRALGINESFLSGEANYSTMEIALSVFIEMIRNLREVITNIVFYQKLFPLMARANDFTKKKPANVAHRIVIGKKEVPYQDLLIPQVQWFKQLRPEADQSYLDVLRTMEEQGVPVPLRVWASAGGQNLDRNVEMMKDDLELRKKITEMKEAAGVGGGGEDEGFGAFGAVDTLPIYDESNRFCGISKNEAKLMVRRILKSKRPPSKVIESMFKATPKRVEAAKVLARRLGYSEVIAEPKAVTAALDHLYENAAINGERATHRELIQFNATAKKRGKRNLKPADFIAGRYDGMKAFDKHLYSGRTRRSP